MIRTLLFILAPGLWAQPIVVNIGTLAPEGSAWHQVLGQMAADWKQISKGRITVRVFPSGIQGDEVEMVKRARLGQLQGVMISTAGLPSISRELQCLSIPMLIQSNEELDYMREKLTPKLEAIILQSGFVALNWGDVGWVHFFSKNPVRTPDDVRKVKLMTSAGDPQTESLFKDFGFQVEPLQYTDMAMALQKSMVDAFAMPPLFALLNQYFGMAKNMLNLKWAPLIGATVVSRRAWQRIPEDLKPALRQAAVRAGADLRLSIRKLGEESVVEMEKRGLKVNKIDDGTRALWRAEVRKAYPKLRGRFVSAEMFDEVVRLHETFPGGASRGAR